jgi:hypothetical protein
MASLLKDLETHLLQTPLSELVGTRVFGTQVPDRQELPYVAIEKTDTEYERYSTGKLEKATVRISAYGTTSEQAEDVGRAVLDRMETLFTSTNPRHSIDARPMDDATTAEPDRGKDGIFRYVVPQVFRTVVSVPRS